MFKAKTFASCLAKALARPKARELALINLGPVSTRLAASFMTKPTSPASSPSIPRVSMTTTTPSLTKNITNLQFINPIRVPARAFSTSQSQTDSARRPEEPPKKGLKGLLEKYGAIAIVTYLGIYFITLGGIFFVTLTGIGLTADQILEKMHSWSWVPASVMTKLDRMMNGASPLVINFAAAWGATKLTEPIRLIATAAVVPSVHRWWMAQLQQGRFYPNLPIHAAIGFVALLGIGGILFLTRSNPVQKQSNQVRIEVVHANKDENNKDNKQ